MSPKFMLIYFAVPLENGPPKIMPSPLKASAAVIVGDAAAMISITIKPTKTPAKIHNNDDIIDFVPGFL